MSIAEASTAAFFPLFFRGFFFLFFFNQKHLFCTKYMNSRIALEALQNHLSINGKMKKKIVQPLTATETCLPDATVENPVFFHSPRVHFKDYPETNLVSLKYPDPAVKDAYIINSHSVRLVTDREYSPEEVRIKMALIKSKNSSLALELADLREQQRRNGEQEKRIMVDLELIQMRREAIIAASKGKNLRDLAHELSKLSWCNNELAEEIQRAKNEFEDRVKEGSQNTPCWFSLLKEVTMLTDNELEESKLVPLEDHTFLRDVRVKPENLRFVKRDIDFKLGTILLTAVVQEGLEGPLERIIERHYIYTSAECDLQPYYYSKTGARIFVKDPNLVQRFPDGKEPEDVRRLMTGELPRDQAGAIEAALEAAHKVYLKESALQESTSVSWCGTNS